MALQAGPLGPRFAPRRRSVRWSSLLVGLPEMASTAPPVAESEPLPTPVDDPVEPAWSRGVGIGLLALLVVAFVAAGWWRFTAPFGDNHDGSNAGLWVDTARAILRNGPFAAHLGSRLLTGGVYAHHPPLIAWVTTVADWAGGKSTFADRLPVILGSLAAIGLLVCFLRDRRSGVDSRSVAGSGSRSARRCSSSTGRCSTRSPSPCRSGSRSSSCGTGTSTRAWAPGWLLALVAALCVLASWEALAPRRDRVHRELPSSAGATATSSATCSRCSSAA